jgi:hypothetical protein
MPEGLYSAVPARQKARIMARRTSSFKPVRRPPHPARGLIIPLLLLALLVGGLVWLANSVEEQPTRPIEVDVARDAAK